jgi:hypothetical protein
VVRLVVEFHSDPQVVAAIIAAVAALLAALIGGLFLVRAARIQAQRQPPELPSSPPPKRGRGGRRPSKKGRSP